MTEGEWKSGVDARLKGIESRMAHMETKSAVDEVHRTNVEKRLMGIEDTLKWLVRLIIGALLVGLVGFIVGGGFNVP